MAIFNVKLPTNLTEYPNSFKRQGSFPLEAYSVFYNIKNEDNEITTSAFDAAKNYATSNPIAYVGQILTVIDEIEIPAPEGEGTVVSQVATAYVIDNAAGDLKEVGSAPVGDETSITVDEETGTVSLKGINALVYEREVDVLNENGEATGEKETEEVKYQPLMTKDGLVWVEPSKTTVEGLATLISELTGRVNTIASSVSDNADAIGTLEESVETIKEVIGAPAEGEEEASGLFKELADEIARATKAEEDLSDKIGTDIAAAKELIDADILAAQTKANDAYNLANTKADAEAYNAFVEAYNTYKNSFETTYAEDKAAFEAEDTSIRKIAEYAKTFVDNFLKDAEIDPEGTNNVVDKLKEIQDALKNLGDAVDLAATLSHVNEQLEIVNAEIAKKADEEAVNEQFEAVNAEIAKKVDKTAVDQLSGEIAQSLADLSTNKAYKTYVDETFTTKKDFADHVELYEEAMSGFGEHITEFEGHIEEFEQLVGNLETKQGEFEEAFVTVAGELLELKNNKANSADVYTKDEVYTKVETNARIQEVLDGLSDTTESAASVANELKDYKTENAPKFEKLEGIDPGAEVNIIEAVKLNGTALDVAADRSVNIVVSAESLEVYKKDHIDIISGKVDKNVEDIAAHATEFSGLKGTVQGLETTVADLSSTKADKSVVDGHTTLIANLELNKADKSVVNEHTTAISELSTNKANISDVYTKG